MRTSFFGFREGIPAPGQRGTFWEGSGLDAAALAALCQAEERTRPEESHAQRKANRMALLLEQGRFGFGTRELFPHVLDVGDLITELHEEWQREIFEGELADLRKAHAMAQEGKLYTGTLDYSHTCPDWDAILTLGIPGLIARLQEADSNNDFSASTLRVLSAVTVYMERLSAAAARLGEEDPAMGTVAEALQALTHRAPMHLYEAMLLMILFYYLQTEVECTPVRSLGDLDRLFAPFYEQDLESGWTTKEDLRELIAAFLLQLRAFGNENNIPIFLCGVYEDGLPCVNELSYLLLEIHDELGLHDPKLQIRYRADLPEDLLERALDMIRRGNNSIVFVNDPVVIESLQAVGISESAARRYVPVGCYEPLAMGQEVAATCSGRVNLAKALALLLCDGRDWYGGNRYPIRRPEVTTFNEFYQAYREYLGALIANCRTLIAAQEPYYAVIHPSPLFSSSFASCAERERDAYEGGVTYNNTSIVAFGVATAVDSLLTIREAVFREKTHTLQELAQAMETNWEGQEALYHRVTHVYPKYGRGDADADALGADLLAFVASCINGYSNGRGGVFRFGAFSIDWDRRFGRKCGATPDGRQNGAPLSRNLSASAGQDRFGVTGLVRSASSLLQRQIPDGAVLDLCIHSTATQGADGLIALRGLLEVYFARGGMALQMNVLDPAVLRRARECPREYSNLQIRLCGWNVFFTDLDAEEQEALIARAEQGGGV